MLDYVDEPLSKEMIIEMNKILKRGTSDEDNPRYNVGGFKVVPNTIGVVNMIETSSPETTEQDVDSLLDDYSKLTQVTLEDIIDFHVKFERIHPFVDGNGPLGQQKTYLQKYLQNKVFTDFGKSFFKYTI